MAAPAAAIGEGANAQAETRGEGVDLRLGRDVEGNVVVHRASSTRTCTWRVEEYRSASEVGFDLPASAIQGSSGPDSRVYVVSCGAEYVALQWLGGEDFVAAVAPVVDELVRRVEVLQSGIQIRPDNRGITGIPSMFWIDGPGANPQPESVEAFGLTVTVSFALVGVEWNFGDGTPTVQGGLGEAYPQHSSIQHTYQDASPDDVPYRVTATLRFQPSYTVDGTPGDALAPIPVTITRDYLVRQLQTIRKR